MRECLLSMERHQNNNFSSSWIIFFPYHHSSLSIEDSSAAFCITQGFIQIEVRKTFTWWHFVLWVVFIMSLSIVIKLSHSPSFPGTLSASDIAYATPWSRNQRGGSMNCGATTLQGFKDRRFLYTGDTSSRELESLKLNILGAYTSAPWCVVCVYMMGRRGGSVLIRAALRSCSVSCIQCPTCQNGAGVTLIKDHSVSFKAPPQPFWNMGYWIHEKLQYTGAFKSEFSSRLD